MLSWFKKFGGKDNSPKPDLSELFTSKKYQDIFQLFGIHRVYTPEKIKDDPKNKEMGCLKIGWYYCYELDNGILENPALWGLFYPLLFPIKEAETLQFASIIVYGKEKRRHIINKATQSITVGPASIEELEMAISIHFIMCMNDLIEKGNIINYSCIPNLIYVRMIEHCLLYPTRPDGYNPVGVLISTLNSCIQKGDILDYKHIIKQSEKICTSDTIISGIQDIKRMENLTKAHSLLKRKHK